MANTQNENQDVLLSVENLSIGIREGKRVYPAVDGVSFQVHRGEVLGVVGESGCGKTVTNLAVMGLLPPSLSVTGGRILFAGQDLTALSEKERNRVNGSRISMIYQEPLTCLNPLLKIGTQVGESLRIHESLPREEIRARVEKALAEVGLPDPKALMDCYPHQLSGGQRQRVMIAMATICRPDLMIADEPTTALDVTVQAKILRLLKHISVKHHMSILFISHDLAVISQICDRVMVMYAGKICEVAGTDELMRAPLHPYTKGLLRSIPTRDCRGQDLPAIGGHVPAITEPRTPCPFADRCPLAVPLCREQAPVLAETAPGHFVSCHVIQKGGRL
jgi:peptide/nickel transport system ATP-binding protein